MSTLKVILLEKFRHKGNLGDIVNVKPGFARNFLLPTKKAVKATPENIQKFKDQRAEFEKRAAQVLASAQERAAKIQSASSVTISAKVAEESGKLYGSVGIADIQEALNKVGIKLEKSEIKLPLGVIRHTGEHEVQIYLHSEVTAILKVMIIPD